MGSYELNTTTTSSRRFRCNKKIIPLFNFSKFFRFLFFTSQSLLPPPSHNPHTLLPLHTCNNTNLGSMRSNPSLSWQKLQDVYYSIRTCYDGVKWSIDNLYSNFHVAYSSPLTVIATASKFVPYPNVIDIYAINGAKLWSIVYNSTLQDHIVGFCFHQERLCVVLSNHKFRLYTDFEGTFDEYYYTDGLVKLLNASDGGAVDNFVSTVVITDLENNQMEEPFSVQQVFVWADYLVLRNRDKITFTNLIDFSNCVLPLQGLTPSNQNGICFLNGDETSLTFLLSYKTTIYNFHVNFANGTFEMVDEKLTDGPFSIISAAPNGSLVALLNEELSKIFVITKDFDRILLEYDTSNESSLPYMIEWAGNDAIVLSLRDEIKLIGPGQKSVSFFYDIIEHEEFNLELSLADNSDDLSFGIPLIKSEKDGLKIISKNKVEFLSRVPDCSVNLHLMGSTHPSLILLDCVDKLALQASKADSNISLLKSEKLLNLAISSCLDAALEEFQPIWQRKILKAVSFGKVYQEGAYSTEKYLHVLNTIKVLNQIRAPEISLFLTYSEIVDCGWHAIIRMLLIRSQHLLALKVVELLGLEESRSAVYVDWCQRKVKKEFDMSDDDLFVLIAKKLLVLPKGEKNSINLHSISEIFDVSHQEGRIDLCKQLVNLEPSGSARMKQLLRIDETELALIKCFQSCDYDLCKLLFLHLKNTRSVLQVFQIISQNEIKIARESSATSKAMENEFLHSLLRENVYVSGDLVATFFRHAIASTDPEILDTFLKNEDRSIERDAIALKALRNNVPVFEDGEEQYDNINQWYMNKLRPLKAGKKLKKVVDVESDLLDLQYRLSNTFQRSFFQEKSVVDVIKKLLKMNQIKQASKVVKEFGIGTQKFWFLVLEVFCKVHDFDRLHKFISASNPNSSAAWKSPIGFLLIVEQCVAYDAPKDLTTTYIGHCSDLSYGQRVGLYIKNGDVKAAAKEAYLFKDPLLLKQLLGKAETNDEALIKDIKAYIHELS